VGSLLHSTELTCSIDVVALDWIEQCFTSPPTQYRRFFTGQKTQPTVSKYWKKKQRKTTQRTKKTQNTHMHTHTK